MASTSAHEPNRRLSLQTSLVSVLIRIAALASAGAAIISPTAAAQVGTCTNSGATRTCSGDWSGGITFPTSLTLPPNLVVQNLTAPIRPPASTNGIQLTRSFATNVPLNLTIDNSVDIFPNCSQDNLSYVVRVVVARIISAVQRSVSVTSAADITFNSGFAFPTCAAYT